MFESKERYNKKKYKKYERVMAVKAEKNMGGNCETCLYFDFDEEWQVETCTLDIDEDEMERLASGRYASCPYYRFYDEYKFVQKQN